MLYILCGKNKCVIYISGTNDWSRIFHTDIITNGSNGEVRHLGHGGARALPQFGSHVRQTVTLAVEGREM